MPVLANDALTRIRGGISLGFGVQHMRGAAAPLLAKAAGYDWLFIDTEHGALSTDAVSQLCLSSLTAGIAPIVRVCRDALDEGTRALDAGALGLVIPHIDTVEDAREIVAAFRFPPVGHRSTGGPCAQFGYRPPGPGEMQRVLNETLLLVPMIETAKAIDNAEAIAAVPGIDALLIGSNDLTLDMGIPGQYGDPRLQDAYARVIAACKKHGKIAGMGGIYDSKWAPHYIGMGARMILSGSDHGLLFEAATARAKSLREAVKG
ncbi:MAG TPA: aldolase/citrate lyase family protein [Pseudolabrys sp.]|nr:aldolase/citrate lyase family protein [Pseudolabrys sp.]